MIGGELIVDSFAGGGGASLGIAMALGRAPDIAINHDAEAIAMHAANHPETIHLAANVWQVDPVAATRHRPVGLMWASPDCKHFSKAKGGKPVSRGVRDLAWVVVRWAKQVRPRVILLENVEEFRTWGPLGEDQKPDPARRGETFLRWVGELKRLGYRVEHRELRACDYGAPTIRKRLFLIARRDGEKIVWPKPTHGDPRSDAVKSGALLPWRAAAEILDWSLPCPSIFLTADEAKTIGVKRPLAEATMARIAKGVKRYVIDAAEPFVVTINHAGARFRGQGVGEPFKTITGARDAHGLVAATISRQFDAMEDAHEGQFSEGFGDPPAGDGAGQQTVDPRAATPVRGDDDQGTGQGGRADHEDGRAHRLFERGVVLGGPSKNELTPGSSLVAPHLMTMRNSQKPHNGANEPTHTITSGGAHINLVAAFLAQHNGGMVGHAAAEPMSTVTAKGCNQATVSAGLVSMRGSDQRSRDVEDPHPTVTAQGCHSAEVRAFLIKYYGNERAAGRRASPHHSDPRPVRPRDRRRRAFRDRRHRHAHADAARAVPRPGFSGQLRHLDRPGGPHADAGRRDPHVRQFGVARRRRSPRPRQFLRTPRRGGKTPPRAKTRALAGGCRMKNARSDRYIPVLDHGFVRLVDAMGSDISIVRAARVSYDAAWRAGEDEGSIVPAARPAGGLFE